MRCYNKECEANDYYMCQADPAQDNCEYRALDKPIISFNDWWDDQTKDSDQWGTLERLAAKDAWEFATRQGERR